MTNNTAPLADAYAALKFEEEKIKERLGELKKEILSTGVREIVGDTCELHVVAKKGATTFNKKAAIKLLVRLGATDEQIAALSAEGKPTEAITICPKLALAA